MVCGSICVILVLALCGTIMHASSCSLPVLESGSEGKQVVVLQYFLTVLDFPVKPDGFYGSGMVSVVEQAQVAFGLSQDGTAGPETLGNICIRLPKVWESGTEPNLVSGLQTALSVNVTGTLDGTTITALNGFLKDMGFPVSYSSTFVMDASVWSLLFGWMNDGHSDSSYMGCSLYPVPSNGQFTFGVDLSVFQGNVSSVDFHCLVKAGYQRIVIEAQRSNGEFNPYFKWDYERAVSAGFANVDAYLFIDFQGSVFQCKTTAESLSGVIGNDYSSKLWLDIEGNPGTSVDGNMKILNQCVTDLTNSGFQIGVYSNQDSWGSITGNTNSFGNLDLWYALYDGLGSCDGFEAFGGFTAPFGKQFVPTTNVCGTQVDVNLFLN